jgi:hypothetical protein
MIRYLVYMIMYLVYIGYIQYDYVFSIHRLYTTPVFII